MAATNKTVEQQYTARDIQVLEGLEAVRRRPGMYIGGTDQRGLHHLLFEIADNSIDEAMAGHCDRIWIHIAKDGRVTVRDNGWGIPIDTHPRHRQVGAGDGHDRAARRRQVRRPGLQGLRRPARRRRLGRQRALGEHVGRGAPQRQALPPGVRARHPDHARCSTVKESWYDGPDTGDLADDRHDQLLPPDKRDLQAKSSSTRRSCCSASASTPT